MNVNDHDVDYYQAEVLPVPPFSPVTGAAYCCLQTSSTLSCRLQAQAAGLSQHRSTLVKARALQSSSVSEGTAERVFVAGYAESNGTAAADAQRGDVSTSTGDKE